MVTQYVFATVVGGKGGASFYYYVDGAGFIATSVGEASQYSANQVVTNQSNIAIENGGVVAIIPIVIGA